MATTLPEARSEPSYQPAPPENEEFSPEVIVLEDRLPEWFRSRPNSLAVTLVVAVIFVLLNSIPLSHTDLWGHLNYGRIIWNTKSIPATEPTMSLAQGVEMVDTAWLSQLLAYGTFTVLGAAGLKFLFASSIVLVAALIAHVVRRRTGGVLWPSLAVVGMVVVGWKQLAIIRPQLAGFVCFGLLLHWTLTQRRRNSDWFLIPALFVLWANLHGSFIVGLLVLASQAVGNFVDYLRASRRIGLALRAPAVVRSVLLTELAAVACLLNPYGLEIYHTVLTFSDNPNLINLVDWDPLTLRMIQGRAAAVLAVGLFWALRATPRRIRGTEFFLLFVFGGLALWTSRMLLWWVPVAVCILGIHGHAAWMQSSLYRSMTRKSRRQVHDDRWNSEPTVARSLWSVASIGIVFIAFSLTPLSMQLRTGTAQEFSNAVSSGTPVNAAEFINQMEQRPSGVVLNTFEWGDYLQWSCQDLDVFTNSHVHLIPQEVWSHYIDLSNGAGASSLLDRYGVNLVVVRVAESERLIRGLREDGQQWNEVYTDDMATIFVRRKPI